MDAPKLSTDAPLPDDVVTLQAMVRDLLAEVARLRAENAELRGKLDAALKHRFGRRSERQLATADAKKNKPGRAKPHGRAALPESLERRQILHDLTEAEKLCPCCGWPRVCIGEQTAGPAEVGPLARALCGPGLLAHAITASSPTISRCSVWPGN